MTPHALPPPDPVWIAPFAALLLSIAVFPLVALHWWEKKYPFVALGLGALVAAYYAFVRHDVSSIQHSALEYISFIALVGSLFVVAGGLHIHPKGQATPLANAAFLLAGGAFANIVGTTGASMVLIRPWIRVNKYRVTSFHIIFFIFVVSNIGGGLTPIGDPPLFLGYLRGVPFFWVIQHVWAPWLLTMGLVVAVFYFLDRANFARAAAEIREKETGAGERFLFMGKRNVVFLGVIVASVFINNPPFLREGIMLAAAVASYLTTGKHVHELNKFSFGPLKEVAILFAGIFLTMVPALQWLEHAAAGAPVLPPAAFYWLSGGLSAVLDNAPTYLNFLTAAQGMFGDHAAGVPLTVSGLLELRPEYVKAISVAAVYFGAMTYIGNGPNFLVKAVAEHSGVRMPSFFGYVARYSVPVLLPVLALVWLLFFRG